MGEKVSFNSFVIEGKLSPECSNAIRVLLRNMEGRKLKITIEPQKKIRSISQNKFYWGVIIPILQELFYQYGNICTDEDIHEFVKKEIWKLRKQIIKPDGEIDYITGSSTELSTIDWESRIDLIRVWAAEQGVLIPFPNEVKNDQ